MKKEEIAFHFYVPIEGAVVISINGEIATTEQLEKLAKVIEDKNVQKLLIHKLKEQK